MEIIVKLYWLLKEQYDRKIKFIKFYVKYCLYINHFIISWLKNMKLLDSDKLNLYHNVDDLKIIKNRVINYYKNRKKYKIT